MNIRPIVSIIIPVFNARDTVRFALESVIHQSFKSTEIIVIDGKSSDGTLEILKEFEPVMSTFISEEDGGIYDAINKGIDRATGDWIYVLGADDMLQNNEVLQNIFKSGRNNCSLVFGAITHTSVGHPLVRKIHNSTFGPGLIFRNTLHQQSVFYRRSLFEGFRFNTSYRVLADYDFHLKLRTDRVTFQHIQDHIACCAATGVSKHFGWALYSEELRIKRKRLSTLAWLINVPWVIIKFVFKRLLS